MTAIQKPNNGRKGFIYLALAEKLGALKIGHTKTNPHERVRSLQTGCPAELRLVGYIPGTPSDEKEYHDEFQQHRLHGEWFDATAPSVIDFMMLAGHEVLHNG